MDKRKYINEPLIFLTAGQRKIYDLFFSAMKNGEYQVELPRRINSNNIIYYIKLVVAENPEFCDYDTCVCSFADNGSACLVRLQHAFQDSSMIFNLQIKAKSILDEIIDIGYSDIKKVLAIHDYLIKNVTYRDTLSTDSNISHTAYGAIVNKEAVCEGIAYAFSYLLNSVGIKSTVVDGIADGVPHAWNIVRIKNICYHFDVTWDLIRKDEYNNMIYDYFCLTDMDLKNRIWDRKIYPKCNSHLYNYFNLSKSFAHNETDLIRIIEQQFPKYRAIYLKSDFISSSKETTMNYLWNTFRKVAQQNRWHYGSVKYSFNEDQNVFVLFEK